MQLQRLSDHSSDLESEVSVLTHKIEELSSANIILVEEKTALESVLSVRNSWTKDIEEQLVAMTKSFNIASTRVLELEARVAEYVDSKHLLTTTSDEISDGGHSLDVKLSAALNELHACGLERDSYHAKLVAAEKSEADARVKSEDLEKRLHDTNGLLNSSKAMLRQINSEYSDLQAKVLSLLKKTASKQVSVDSMQSDVTGLSSRLQSCEMELSVTQSKLRTNEAELSFVRTELSLMENKLMEKEKVISQYLGT